MRIVRWLRGWWRALHSTRDERVRLAGLLYTAEMERLTAEMDAQCGEEPSNE